MATKRELLKMLGPVTDNDMDNVVIIKDTEGGWCNIDRVEKSKCEISILMDVGVNDMKEKVLSVDDFYTTELVLSHTLESPDANGYVVGKDEFIDSMNTALEGPINVCIYTQSYEGDGKVKTRDIVGKVKSYTEHNNNVIFQVHIRKDYTLEESTVRLHTCIVHDPIKNTDIYYIHGLILMADQ